MPLKNIHTVNAFPAFGSVSTVKRREMISQCTLAMSCPFRKNVSKKKKIIIMLNTNNDHHNGSHQSIHSYLAHSYSQVLVHGNSPRLPTPVNSANSPLGYANPVPNNITLPIHPFQALEKAAFQMQLLSYLSPLSKTMRFRAPLKRF